MSPKRQPSSRGRRTGAWSTSTASSVATSSTVSSRIADESVRRDRRPRPVPREAAGRRAAPVDDAALGARARPGTDGVHAAGGGLPRRRRAGVGAHPPVRRRLGVRRPVGRPRRRRRPAGRRGRRRRRAARARRRRRAARLLQRLPAPRPRAGAVRGDEPSTARSTARTTAGATGSTARCCRRRGSTSPPASTARSTGSCRSPSRSGTAGSWSTPSATAAPVDEFLDGIEPHVADHEPERLVVGATHSYELATNWKLIVENYQECFHCPNIHPELCAVSPSTSGENYIGHAGMWVGGWQDLMPHAVTMSLSGASAAAPLRRPARRGPPAHRLHRAAAEHARQPAPRLRDDAPPRPDRARPHRRRVPVAVRPGGRRRRRASTRPSPSTSGTSRTARTGRRARRVQRGVSSAASARARSPPRRTPSPSSSASSPRPTWPAAGRVSGGEAPPCLAAPR